MRADRLREPPLAGLQALVIGGGSGIGLETARVLAAEGAAVTIAGRNVDKLDAASHAMEGDGLSVARVPCDALIADQVRDAVDSSSDDGKLDIAVVVPGGGSISPVLMFGDDQFSAEIDLNVRPVYLLLKYAGRAMIRAEGGSFVAISSSASAFSTRYLASYSAGKAAVDQLVRVAADELGQYGVRVNSVRPGMTRTPATAGAFANQEMTAAFHAGQPIARSGEVADVANAVRYLVGPESSWVTGQALSVDGGHTLRAFVDYDTLLEMPDQGEVARRRG